MSHDGLPIPKHKRAKGGRKERPKAPPETIPCAFPGCSHLGRMAFCSEHWQFTTWSRADIFYAKTPEERWTAIQLGIMQIALGLDRLGAGGRSPRGRETKG